MTLFESKRQELLDRFYFSNGQCCAGCDWWRSVNSQAGECIKAAPVDGEQRYAMLNIVFSSMPLIGAGHPFTSKGHYCGDFKDNFDWASLSAHYLRRIGRAP